MISKRIKELGEFVPIKKRIIDVGCDHALLDIYLAKKHDELSLIATDISSSAISIARKNIIDSNLENRVKTLVTDGLNNIMIDEDDAIVISGMGTNTIIEIVSPYIDAISDIVIQTNRDIEKLRQFMFQNGFNIANEKIVYDDRFYVFIHFKKGKTKYEESDLWLGPIIKNSENIDYFKFLMNKYTKILSSIKNDDSRKNAIKKRVELLDGLIQNR